MPHSKVRSKNLSRKKSAKQPKPWKVSPAILKAVESLQYFVEDHDKWAAEDEKVLLLQLEQMLVNLRKLQKEGQENVIPRRNSDSFSGFCGWLSSNGIELDEAPFRIDFTPGSENNDVTLLATRLITEDELIMSIPSSVMLTASNSPIKALESLMPALATMPSLSLALHLLYEASNPESRFKPYIDILPNKFTTPFANFTPQHMLSLRPSHASGAAIKSLRAQIRNYTYIYSILSSQRAPIISPRILTFKNFVWALSVVMTRQNALPSTDPPTLALVPLWDLCNHEPGHFTTQVLVDTTVTVECRAMRSFQPGEPITIFYGPRPNVKLLLFSGFVQVDNAYDMLPVSLTISGEEPLAPLKARALAKLGVDVQVVVDEIGSECDKGKKSWACNVGVGKAIVAEALAVARVLSMDKPAFTDWLKRGASLPERTAVNSHAEADAKQRLAKVVREQLKLYSFLGDGSDGSTNNTIDMTPEVHKLLLNEKKLLEADLNILENTHAQQQEVVEVEGIQDCSCCAAHGDY
ncbi:unnamed protein product [Agarophyton chilense]|eukprot:gb/GEZJ01001908.1/.p1 GENE.gb/GEZJ01001908.1/~~gb/GEZJ01001908.1/.p1  ORF type:complete len:523 (+),score=75.83 gb/GEZJ01001908.1/:662-2230(+)